MNHKNLVAIYCRLSEEDKDKIDERDDSRSIQNQKSMLINYAMKQGWEVFNIYCDDNYSGAYSGNDNTRPAFNEMLNDAKQKKFNIVLCKTQSRFTRNMEEVEKYIHGAFIEWGIRFVSVIDNADTSNNSNKKLRQFNGLINEWYLEDLSENIRGVFEDKMQKGEFLASFPPYGYIKDINLKNHLVIHSETSSVVKQIFNWHVEGYGAAKICRMLNDKGIPNPRKQQEINGLRKQFMYAENEMGKWSTTTIGDILHNQVYCGDVIGHKVQKVSYKSKKNKKVSVDDWIVVPNMHEAIIDRETFEKVQKSLSAKRKSTGTGKPHKLAGKVFCHYCGKPMQKTHSSTNKTEHIEYLRCRDKYAYSTSEKCATPNIRVDTVLDAMQMGLITKFEDAFIENMDNEKVNYLLFDFEESIKKYQNEISKLETNCRKVDDTVKSLYMDKVSGIITAKQFIDFNNDFLSKKETYENQIAILNLKLAKLQEENQRKDNIQFGLEKFFKTKNIDEEIIDTLVERIEFGEINPKTKKPILKFIWSWE